MDITNLKPIIKRVIGKQFRPVLRCVNSNGTDLSMTDLETYLTLKNMNLPIGLLDLDSLGITNQVSDLDLTDYPLFPEVETKNYIKISIKDLETLLESASDDETRIYLNGIAWVETELVSTNGHIMTLLKGQTKNKEDSSILPRTTLKELVSLSKKFKLSEANILVGKDYFKVDNERFTLFGRIINREYCRYKSVVPTKTSNEITITNPVKLKTIKDILDRNQSIHLNCELGVTTLTVKGTEFKAQVGNTDFNTTVGFNLKYLEFLTDLDNKLMFNNELSPFMVVKGNVTRVAMPMKA